MLSFKVFVFCLALKGVSSLVTRTFPGAAVQLDTKTHVLTLNQSQSFIFEVQSCGTVNITLLNLYRAARIHIDIPTGEMNITICDTDDGKTTLKCTHYTEVGFAAGSCLTASQFWVDVPLWTGYFIGSGCELRTNSISQIYYANAELGYNVIVASEEEATWKFGTDACAPPTTTTTTTTTPTTTKGSENGHIDLYCKSAGVTRFPVSSHASIWIFLYPLCRLITYL